MISLKVRLIIAATLLVAAGAMTQIRAEKPILYLLPTPGIANQVSLNTNQTYTYSFSVNQPINATRIGLYLAPIGSLPADTIPLDILQDGKKLSTANLSGVFIDSEGPSYWHINPPIKMASHKPITISLALPPQFVDKIRLKTRQPDESFSIESTSFRINEVSQPYALGYEVYSGYIPPLAIQLATLAALSAIALFVQPKNQMARDVAVYLAALAATAAYLFPTIGNGPYPWFLLATGPLLIVGVYWYAKGRGFHAASAAAAANILGYGSWLPLQYSAGRYLYGLVAAVVLLHIYVNKNQPKQRRHLALGMIVGLILIIASLPFEPAAYSYLGDGHSNVRDIFLDPYQVPHAEKAYDFTSSLPAWHNFGAYIGIPAFVATIIGIFSSLRRHPILIIIVTVFSTLISIYLPSPLAIPLGHASIVLVSLFAYFAALGLENLRRFLGYKDKLVSAALALVALIITLDMWHTCADVFNHLW